MIYKDVLKLYNRVYHVVAEAVAVVVHVVAVAVAEEEKLDVKENK